MCRHKFETYITSDWPSTQANGDEVPDCDDTYSTVVTSCLNGHCLMYGAEVDCCIQSEHTDLNNYCEIKTSKGMLHVTGPYHNLLRVHVLKHIK